jgi:hypothetical protein
MLLIPKQVTAACLALAEIAFLMPRRRAQGFD